MMGLGFGEILAIGVILFVFFGAKRLPALGSSLAEGIRNFQKGLKKDSIDHDTTPKINDEEKIDPPR